MKLMTSKYDGHCAAPTCLKGGQTLKGQSIYWHKDHNGSKVWHRECVTAMQNGAPSNLPAGPVPGLPVPVPMPVASPGNPTITPVAASPNPSWTTRTCIGCPSLVQPQDAARVIGAPLNSYVCAARGIVLTRPGAVGEEVMNAAEEVARNCTVWNQPRPINLPDHCESRVGVGVLPTPATTVKRIPSTCADCRYYAEAADVMREYGWGTGMCTALGKLIFPTKVVREALNCGMGDAGAPVGDPVNVQLLPRFTPEPGTPATTPQVGQPVNIPQNISMTARAQMRHHHEQDPRSYPTDREVTDAQRAIHIRAWRKVEDPDAFGEPIFVPIFDGPTLMAAECKLEDHALCDHDPRSTYGNHRPDLYVDHADMLYQFAAVMIGADYSPLLEGPSGTGKTEALCWWAWLMDIPFIRIAISKGTEVYHLAGENKLVADPVTGQIITQYHPGRFFAWYDRSCVIGVDEANLKADVWEFLRPAADGAKRMTLDDAQGLTAERGNATFFALTQNPSWDPLYVGTEPVSAADLQRVVPFWFDYPTEEVEREIILAHCHDAGYQIPPRTLDQIMQISNDIREMRDSIPVPWGVRSNIKVAKFSQFFRLPMAYRRAVLDGQEREVVELINQSISSVVV